MKEIYEGNIYMVTSIDKEKLDFFKKYDVIDQSNMIKATSKSVLAKEDAYFIEINRKYVDISQIKTLKDMRDILILAKSYTDNNITLKREEEISNPYVGQLYIKKIKRIK